MDDTPAHILIVDDDAGIRTLLQKFLQRHGYRTSSAASAEEARQRMAELQFDLLVLDIMLPGESGLQLARALRKDGRQVPILILTARGEPPQRVEGLQLGVDDYMPKPFEPEELLLRLGNILRHRHAPPPPQAIRFGAFRFVCKSGLLTKGQQRVALTTSEIEMLRCFAAQPGKIISRAELLAQAASAGARSERVIDVQINRLRRKIEQNPKEPLLLQTVRGAGYILHMDPSEDAALSAQSSVMRQAR